MSDTGHQSGVETYRPIVCRYRRVEMVARPKCLHQSGQAFRLVSACD